ncbi:hypothetical protein A3J20_00845 [Candidatus Gottesmanbacteria bacterium RIFCSPLOWO2_02_FULL_42_29]|uniref:Uncharacterized protein n=2 Tax=Candidatus Gottesmaniibacteriota TaxID=1752720 RepID=A0A1F6BEK8_9BACT|nr:MAG: hypothetical protein UV09_C0023G0022 [Candidatus Gottesmanbacteria bacterium GW2011_GWA2_42_18]OGG12270.1 MAG: hypothetical protein A2781_02620 [Candidatus Gottesmanbacteria bacterium RIFCSPHIGHO2_01_FULL_42_27]OGG35376.1 MAG: hypothetical protein A2968_04675 [Candidatus Gottesmanbacteria bacterium RIFCSPLOWO2_01_FULL_42_22]OGG39467.1 MAG: hypothetical protein A3J20_00845 [Candidatus Gottesmanbacteria bacterium RIFCSPLOWO2_02_FULL_42_29]
MNRKELYLLAIIIFMTVVAWVSFGIFHARNKTSEYRVKAKNIEPLNPVFDLDIIEQLKHRRE